MNSKNNSEGKIMNFDNISQPETKIFQQNQENFIYETSIEDFFKTNSKDGILFIKKPNFESLVRCEISKQPFCSAGIVISSQSIGKKNSNVYGLLFDKPQSLVQTAINCERIFKDFPVCSAFFKPFRETFQLPSSTCIREVLMELFGKNFEICSPSFEENFGILNEFDSAELDKNFSDEVCKISSLQFIDIVCSRIFAKDKIYCQGGIDESFEKEQRKMKFFSSLEPQRFLSSLFLDLYQLNFPKKETSTNLLQSYFAPNDVFENSIHCFKQNLSQKDKINVEDEKKFSKQFFSSLVDHLFSENKFVKETVVGGFNLGVANSILKKTSIVKALERVQKTLVEFSEKETDETKGLQLLSDSINVSKAIEILVSRN